MNRSQVMTIPSELVRRAFNERRFYWDDAHVALLEELIHDNATFVDRELAEGSTEFRQIVSCAVVLYEDKVLCVRRSRRSNRNELKLRWTIMIGGHVDDGDRLADDPLKNCVIRELKEELGIEPVREPRVLGVVADPATQVGRLHLGVVFLAESNSDEIVVNPKSDNEEFVNSKRTNTYKMYDSNEMINLDGKFDPWTSLFLESSLALSILQSEVPIVSQTQKEFSFEWR